MEKRQLGVSSLTVAPITFGGNVFGWTADEAISFKILDAFVGAGFDFIDTADVYSRWNEGNEGGEVPVNDDQLPHLESGHDDGSLKNQSSPQSQELGS